MGAFVPHDAERRRGRYHAERGNEGVAGGSAFWGARPPGYDAPRRNPPPWTLCVLPGAVVEFGVVAFVPHDAERRRGRYHAERGNEGVTRTSLAAVPFGELASLVTTLRVVTHRLGRSASCPGRWWTFGVGAFVPHDAERRRGRYHAERGNEGEGVSGGNAFWDRLSCPNN
ncbi:hypothetical protein JCM17961_24530 [Endothiovibrio diazotrophicus]